MDYDVAIVGAGVAGLIAARDLGAAGRRIALIEAQNRFGGRIRSIEDPGALAPIELGAEFVHGRPAITYALLRAFGATVIDDADASFAFENGTLHAVDDDRYGNVAKLLARALERPDDESVDDALARDTPDSDGDETAVWARRLVAGFDAADPARASARAIAREWAGDASAGGAQSRAIGGYAPLVAHLARDLDPARVDVRLETVVTRVVRDARGVTIDAIARGARVTFRARRAIVTVPLGVLAAAPDALGAIAFEPSLPPSTSDAIGTIASGSVHKIVLRFRDPFWESLRDGAWRDGAFFTGDGAFPTLWTQLPVRANTLVAWVGGPGADELAATSADDRARLALACAGRYLGDPDAAKAAFVAAYAHDWQRDPFARGAYTYVLVGGERSREALAAPVDGVLWFAGEATAADGEGGTVAGALTSGVRAARDVLAR